MNYSLSDDTVGDVSALFILPQRSQKPNVYLKNYWPGLREKYKEILCIKNMI